MRRWGQNRFQMQNYFKLYTTISLTYPPLTNKISSLGSSNEVLASQKIKSLFNVVIVELNILQNFSQNARDSIMQLGQFRRS